MVDDRGRRGRRRLGWSTAAQEIVNRVFVYGSLRSGQTARSMIAEHVEGSEPATMPGRIYVFDDGYPAMVAEGDELVVGELVALRDLAAAFPLLDAYEGDDYHRLLKRATLEDGSDVWAWVYVLADPATSIDGELVIGGDWVGAYP